MCSLLDGNKSPRSYSGRPEWQQSVSWLCTREAGLALYLLVDGKGGGGDLIRRVGEVYLLFLKTKLSLGQRVGLKATGQPLDKEYS